MNPYYTILLLAFLILLAILLIRYVNNTVDREFRSLAQAANDTEYRAEELRRVDALLLGLLPLPPDAEPLPGPKAGLRGALPPVLLALGMILLWGAGSVPRDRALWFYGGLAALVLAAIIMLATLQRRKRARVARLLLFRADLRRLDNRRAEAADDLRQLLRLTPWDDSAWAELSDDLAAQGKLSEAFEAIETAAGIDPKYDEYRMLEASLAIRMKRLDRARAAIDSWREIDGVGSDDPRLIIYDAAIDLARGERDRAEAALKRIAMDGHDSRLYFLDADQALEDVRKLLPGRVYDE